MRQYLREDGDEKKFCISLVDGSRSALAYGTDHVTRLIDEVERDALEALARGEQFDRKTRLRNIYGTIEEVLVDGAGRFSLPGTVKKHCRIEEGILFIGVGNFIELWDVEQVQSEQDVAEALRDAAQDFLSSKGGAK